MVYVDCVFQSTIFLDHLVFIGDAADSIGSFPSRCQLGDTFGRGGEGDLIGVGGKRGWRGGHCR